MFSSYVLLIYLTRSFALYCMEYNNGIYCINL